MRENRSMTVLEIGAGPVQPLARHVGETFLKNDKYRCALIRINPIRERRSQYRAEKEAIQKLIDNNQVYDKEGQPIGLSDFEVPDYVGQDNRYITNEEQKEYDALKN
jgi:hypothetical protein